MSRQRRCAAALILSLILTAACSGHSDPGASGASDAPSSVSTAPSSTGPTSPAPAQTLSPGDFSSQEGYALSAAVKTAAQASPSVTDVRVTPGDVNEIDITLAEGSTAQVAGDLLVSLRGSVAAEAAACMPAESTTMLCRAEIHIDWQQQGVSMTLMDDPITFAGDEFPNSIANALQVATGMLGDGVDHVFVTSLNVEVRHSDGVAGIRTDPPTSGLTGAFSLMQVAQVGDLSVQLEMVPGSTALPLSLGEIASLAEKDWTILKVSAPNPGLGTRVMLKGPTTDAATTSGLIQWAQRNCGSLAQISFGSDDTSGNSSGRSVAYYCENGSLRVVSDGEPGRTSTNGPDEYDEELAQSLLDQAGH